MKGVILHGGRGTRLRPITYSEVKQLVPVGGKPMSQYALEDMLAAGIRDIAIVVGDIGTEEIEQYYGDGSKWGARITYVHQKEPAGIAQAVGLTENFVGESPFVVYLGDNLLHGGIAKLKKNFEVNSYDAMISLTRVKDASQFGVAVIDGERIVRLLEKPKNPPTDLAIAGIYFLKPIVFRTIETLMPSSRGEYEITDTIQNLVDQGAKVGWMEIEGWWKDTGTMEDIIEANRLALDECKREILSQVIDEKNLSGRVRVMKHAEIDGKSKIRGPCFIGEGAKISNSYIGPYTSIGNNCVIDGVEIEDSIIMDGCIIRGEGDVRINESLLGARCKVSKGNGARKATKLLIGRNSELQL